MVSQYNLSNSKAQVFKSFSELNGGVFSSDSFGVFSEDDIRNTIVGDYDVLNTSFFMFNFDVLAFDKEVLNNFRPDISKGKWLDEVEANNDYLPAVLTRNVSGIGLNDIIDLHHLYTNDIIKIKIVGIQRVNFSLNLNVGGHGFSSSDIVRSDNVPRLIVNRNMALEHIHPDLEIKTSSTIIVTESQNVIADFKNYGYLRSFNEIYESGIDDRNSRVLFFLPLTLLLFSVSMSGLIGCSILAIIRNMKSFAIFMMIGYNKIDITKIIISYLVLICMCSSFFGVIIYYLLGNSSITLFLHSAILVKLNSFIIPLIILSIVIMIGFVPLSIIKKQQLKEILRRDLL
jgi:ABC-type antimicrobial peptide transport system permease subunit